MGTEVDRGTFKGYGNFKDKAIDIKYQLVPEGKYMPALAIGIMDPHGTRIYPSQYVVISKQIYPFDFTLGFGNGRFGNKTLPSKGEGIGIEILNNPEEWLNDSQFFGGIQFAPSEKYALMVEYSPIKYHKQINDPAQQKYFLDPVPLKYNFGFRYKPTKWSEIDLSYQRGNQIGANVSVAFDIGKPLLPIFTAPYRENVTDTLNPLSERLTKALYFSGFSDIGIKVQEDELWIEAENERYFYSPKALETILHVVANIAPEHIREFHILLKDNGVPLIQLSTLHQDVKDLHSGKLTIDEFLHLSGIHTETSRTLHVRTEHKKTFRYSIKPAFETFLNDPSGFFKYRLGITAWAGYHPWKGSSFIAGFESYPINTVSTVNEPLSIPVRSDIVLYKKEKVALGKLLFEQIFKTGRGIYARAAGGLLEIQYAGIDAEIAKAILNGRVLLGVSGSAVKKRDHNNPFAFKEDAVKDIYTTAFINTRFNIPRSEIFLDIKAGRFLAGDNGVRFTVSKFINGVTLSAWYSVTDTSIFNDSINRGYHDKGISVSIPLRLFIGTDSKTVYQYTLSPWTRDTGQDIEHFNVLFDYIGRNTKMHLYRDWKKID
jgi:hypothetical protein